MQASPVATLETSMGCDEVIAGKGEDTHLVVSNHDLLNQLALSEVDQIRFSCEESAGWCKREILDVSAHG